MYFLLLSSPLDELIDKLGGAECVAEMTGRRWRVVRQSAADQPTLQLRDSALDAPSSSSSGGLDTLNVSEVCQWALCQTFACRCVSVTMFDIDGCLPFCPMFFFLSLVFDHGVSE